MTETLGDLFLVAARRAGASAWALDRGVVAQLDAELAAAIGRARQAWPWISIADAQIADWLGERAARVETDGPVESLVRLRTSDLILTCACARSDPGALREFERSFMPVVSRCLERFKRGHDFAADIEQAVRDRLFVADRDHRPRIAAYSGTGDLGAWLHAITVRIALNELRSERTQADEEALLTLPAVDADPSLSYLKARCHAQFRAALKLALAALGDRDRSLIHYHYLRGLTTGQIGAIYGVHRVSVSRWLAAARSALMIALRTQLEQQLGIGESEIGSIVALVRSRLEFGSISLSPPTAG